jgi:hypothetical protein
LQLQPWPALSPTQPPHLDTPLKRPPRFDFKPGQSVIAGPPAMVSGMRKMLVASGVGEDDIRTEEFAGY